MHFLKCPEVPHHQVQSTPYSLFRVSDVIIHHHDDLLIRNPISVNNLVGVARIGLGEVVLSSVRFFPEGSQFWSSNEQHVLSHGRCAVNRSLTGQVFKLF